MRARAKGCFVGNDLVRGFASGVDESFNTGALLLTVESGYGIVYKLKEKASVRASMRAVTISL